MACVAFHPRNRKKTLEHNPSGTGKKSSRAFWRDEATSNYGFQYIKDFENMFPQLAEELNVPLLPFLLEGVGGNPKMNLPDRIHPNSSGHQIICQTVYEHLTKYLSKNLP